tara:strand:- start:161 stop:430 length:270 start_codon:yes stop_codon:yes gene_type:complete
MAKEKIVDLKAKAEKISETHLKEIQEMVNTVNSSQFNIGKVEAQKHHLLHELGTAQDKIVLFQDVLIKEYGTYDVNVNDGTINWPKDEK